MLSIQEGKTSMTDAHPEGHGPRQHISTLVLGALGQAPRSWAERSYHQLIYYNKVDKGGHFAAWEEPELFAAEIRAAFRSLR